MRAWATLLTRPGYLVGVRALRASLERVGSAHPLVVMVTGAVDGASRRVLEDEGCLLRDVAAIGPADGSPGHYAAPRFADVWTKLAAWSLTEHERLVVLDADMLVVRGMDELFDVDLPDGGIAACHACRCNPRRISSYPAGWTPEVCAYSHGRGVRHGERLERGDYLNGGLLVLQPDEAVSDAMALRLAAVDDPSRYPFAEQDFLNERYAGRWQPLPYVYNALKTLPQQHPAVWDLAAVRNVHYILDKPWERRPDPTDPRRALDRLWWDAAGSLVDDGTAGAVVGART